VEDCLPSKHEALNSNSSTTKKGKNIIKALGTLTEVGRGKKRKERRGK
jgi:hypothetical protein